MKNEMNLYCFEVLNDNGGYDLFYALCCDHSVYVKMRHGDFEKRFDNMDELISYFEEHFTKNKIVMESIA